MDVPFPAVEQQQLAATPRKASLQGVTRLIQTHDALVAAIVAQLEHAGERPKGRVGTIKANQP